MEFTQENESEVGGFDQRLDTHKTSKTSKTGKDPPSIQGAQNTGTYKIQQKTEKTTKQFKQSNTLWTSNQGYPYNEEQVPDLMQDSDDNTSKQYNQYHSASNHSNTSNLHTNSNLNNNIHRLSNNNNNLANISNNNNNNVNNNNNNSNIFTTSASNTPLGHKVQSQVFIQTNTMHTGFHKQLNPYSNISNPMHQTFHPGEDEESDDYKNPNHHHHNHHHHHGKKKKKKVKYLAHIFYSDIKEYSEEVTGRVSANLLCKNCGSLVKSVVNFEPGKATEICSIVLCFLTCSMCCCPFICNSCKDAVHYCPNCGVVLGVKKF